MTGRSSALRRRRKPSLALRLKVFWVFIVVIVGAAIYAGYVLVTLPALRVRTIDVHIDGLAVTEREVLAAANIDRGKNVWLLDTARIARRIEAIPYVDAAMIVRTLPARLAIVVSEREPAACVQSPARIVTIDERRRILQVGCARRDAVRIGVRGGPLGAPGEVATSPALIALLADAHTLREAHVAVRSVRQDEFGGLVAVDSGGIRILFGDDGDVAEKAKLVGPVLAAARRGRTIRSVDLRAPTTPTVEFH